MGLSVQYSYSLSMIANLVVRSAAVAVVCQFLRPIYIHSLDFRGGHITQYIQLQKSSPAYAALEDVRIDWKTTSPSLPSGEGVQLMAGQSLTLPQATALAPTEPKINYVRLTGLTIKQEENTAIDRQLASLDQNEQRSIAQPILIEQGVDLLPLEERKKVLATYYGNQDWSVPSPSQKIAEKVKQYAEKNPVNPNEQWIVSRQSTPAGESSKIYVGKPKEDEGQGSPKTQEKQLIPDDVNKWVTAHQGDWAKDYFSTQANPFGVSAVESPSSKTLTYHVQGRIKLADGLAYTGPDDQLLVYHIYDGLVQSDGKVWIQEGKFEIPAARLQGYIMAELRTASGELRGAGEIDLYRLPQMPYSQMSVDNLELVLSPVSDGVSAEILSAESFEGHKIPAKSARLFVDELEREIRSIDGYYQDNSFAPGSSFVLRAEEPNHWGSLVVGTSGHRTQIKMFSNSMMEALISLSAGPEAETARQRAIIWGRVVVDGQPVSGAKVELAGDELVQPIYFNSYIPDPKLKETSSNGLFAFVMVTPGLQAVRAYYNGRYLPAEIVPAEVHHVSYVELQGMTVRTATVSVYDALKADQSLRATMNIIGTDVDIEVGKQAASAIQFPGGNGLMVVEADAGEPYEMVRVTVDRKARHLNLPMVPSEWLQRLLTRKRANVEPETGMILGFNQEMDFEVLLDPDANIGPQEIIYFDENGEPLFENHGVKGGGFLIYNVPPGLRTATIVPKNVNKIFSQVLIVEPQIPNVMPN